MRLGVFELEPSGHHLAYARLVIEAARDAGFSPVLLTSERVLSSEEFRVYLSDQTGTFDISVENTPEYDSPFAVACSRLQALRALAKRSAVDMVHVPYADGLVQIAALAEPFSCDPVSDRVVIDGIVMRGSIAYDRKVDIRQLRSWASCLAMCASSWRTIQIIDPLFQQWLARLLPSSLNRRFVLIPDPIQQLTTYTRAEARRQLGIPIGARVVGCVGGLDIRKGVDSLVRAFARSKLNGSDMLLLAGKPDSVVSHELASLDRDIRKRIIWIDGYLETAKMDLALAAMDLVCLPYNRHVGSASIAVRAAAHGKPVLATDSGWLGYMLPSLGLGYTYAWDSLDTNLAAALQRTLPIAQEHQPSERCRRFVKYSSADNFKAHLLQTWLRHQHPKLEMMTWQSVIHGESP